MKKLFLITEKEEFELVLDKSVSIYENILKSLPISGNAKVIDGEVYYIIDVDIPFDGTEKSNFQVGDIVYWKSQKAHRFAIAIFYGNTKFNDFKTPTAASPAIKIGSIKKSCQNLGSLRDESYISIEYK
jgi:hypothetical protein